MCVERSRVIRVCRLQCGCSGDERQDLHLGRRLFTWRDHRWSPGMRIVSNHTHWNPAAGIFYCILIYIKSVVNRWRYTTVGEVSGRKWHRCPERSPSSTVSSSASTDTKIHGVTQCDTADAVRHMCSCPHAGTRRHLHLFIYNFHVISHEKCMYLFIYLFVKLNLNLTIYQPFKICFSHGERRDNDFLFSVFFLFYFSLEAKP